MPDPRDEMNVVCRSAVEFALEQLGKHGNFVPFAVVTFQDGELRLIGLGEDVVTDGGPNDLAKLHQILQSGARQSLYRAAAIASDTRVKMDETGETTDAIHIEVDHVDDDPITCILPYRCVSGGVEQHIDPFLQPSQSTILTRSAP